MFVHETSKATKLKLRVSLLLLLILLTILTILTILTSITLVIFQHTTTIIVSRLKSNQNVKLSLINYIAQPGRAGHSRRRG